MSGILGIGAGGDTGFYDFPLEQSLRFNDDDSAHLSKLWGSAGNKKTFTISMWFKRSKLSARQDLVSFAQDVPILIDSDDEIQCFLFGQTRVQTNRKFRDTSAWYHIVLEVDSTQATSSDRINFYVNGTKETDLQTETYPSQNLDANIYTSSLNMTIGRTYGGSNYFDGYMAEVHFLDGVRADADQFGETKEGIWIPKQYTGSYGSNGFRLTFEDDTTVEGFNTVLYDGSGSTKGVGGVGFEPDFVWIKNRDYASGHRLFDTTRGATKFLTSQGTDAEATNANMLTSFDSDGFTVGSDDSVNRSGDDVVAWCWDAGTGSAASNTDGDITSTVKANTARGFSIVTYTGTGSSATVGHGLSSAPEMVITKARNDTTFWIVNHKDLTNGVYNVYLNADSSQQADGNWTAVPTSSVLNLGVASVNQTSDTYVSYCFHSVTGYSKIGSYTGNGSSGHAITTGFAPAWLMVKRVDAVNSWYIVDNTRTVNTAAGNDDLLYANLANTEGSTNDFFTFTSTGFELNTSSPAVNTSSGEYIYIAFADTREYAFWTDQSGNNNDFQHTNLEHMDVVPDRPTNNFCTVNALSDVSDFILAEGNLKMSGTADSWPTVRGTMGVSSGKWYYEVATVDTTRWGAGWATKEFQTGTTFSTNIADSILAYSTDPLQVYDFGTLRSINGTPAFTTSDILQVAIDVDAGKFWLGINNTWVNDSGGTAGDPAGGSNELETFTAGTEVFPSFVNNRGNLTVNFGQDSTFAGLTAAGGNTDQHGNGDFKYSVPSGFLALCTDNLPNPDINPNVGQTPDEYFNTVLYSGTGASQSITGVGFQPDWVWIKRRSAAASHALWDSVRGTQKWLLSDGNNAEITTTDGLSSFDSDGFTLGADATYGSWNNSGTHVAWNWKAGGTAVSNTDGTVNSSVSANTEAGFSIVTFTGGAAGYTVGHGLSQAPEIVFTFNRTDTAGANYVFTTVIDGSIDYFSLDNNTAKNNDPFSMPAFTSSVFSLDNDYGMDTGDNCVAYCFHSVEGYSKIGSHTGNGSTDGPFVYTGFRPAYVMVKRVDATHNWSIVDSARSIINDGSMEFLLADQTNVEDTDAFYDIVSNGFKIRDTALRVNASGGTYIYMAFAEQPFKYANAR